MYSDSKMYDDLYNGQFSTRTKFLDDVEDIDLSKSPYELINKLSTELAKSNQCLADSNKLISKLIDKIKALEGIIELQYSQSELDTNLSDFIIRHTLCNNTLDCEETFPKSLDTVTMVEAYTNNKELRRAFLNFLSTFAK